MDKYQIIFTSFNNARNRICEARYIDLINRIKAKKTKQLVNEFLEMRIDISKRIEELEDYFDENLVMFV